MRSGKRKPPQEGRGVGESLARGDGGLNLSQIPIPSFIQASSPDLEDGHVPLQVDPFTAAASVPVQPFAE